MGYSEMTQEQYDKGVSRGFGIAFDRAKLIEKILMEKMSIPLQRISDILNTVEHDYDFTEKEVHYGLYFVGYILGINSDAKYVRISENGKDI